MVTLRPKRVDQQKLLRHLQKAPAVAKCIRIAVDYNEDEQLDLADAIGGLLILLESTTKLLDLPGGAP